MIRPLSACQLRYLRLFGIAAVALALALVAEQAEAQIRYRSPAGPTLPSQLNYFRRDVGLLDQYNTFVQPQRQLEAQLRQMATHKV